MDLGDEPEAARILRLHRRGGKHQQGRPLAAHRAVRADAPDATARRGTGRAANVQKPQRHLPHAARTLSIGVRPANPSSCVSGGNRNRAPSLPGDAAGARPAQRVATTVLRRDRKAGRAPAGRRSFRPRRCVISVPALALGHGFVGSPGLVSDARGEISGGRRFDRRKVLVQAFQKPDQLIVLRFAQYG